MFVQLFCYSQTQHLHLGKLRAKKYQNLATELSTLRNPSRQTGFRPTRRDSNTDWTFLSSFLCWLILHLKASRDFVAENIDVSMETYLGPTHSYTTTHSPTNQFSVTRFWDKKLPNFCQKLPNFCSKLPKKQSTEFYVKCANFQNGPPKIAQYLATLVIKIVLIAFQKWHNLVTLLPQLLKAGSSFEHSNVSYKILALHVVGRHYLFSLSKNAQNLNRRQCDQIWRNFGICAKI